MRRRPFARLDAISLTLLCAVAIGCRTDPMPTTAQSVDGTRPAAHPLPAPDVYADRLDDDARRTWQKPDEVIALLGCPEAGTVVDLGAGTGYFLQGLSEAVGPEGRVLALDPEPSMVARMEDRVEAEGLRNVTPALIPTDDPDLRPGSVDRILIVNTWHHIDDRARYAGKLREALGPGGLVLVVDYTLESPNGPPASRRLTVDTVRAELESGGLVTEVLEESLPYQYVVAGRAP